MNKNRSVVIVRYNDAIDGVLCKERHFVGIDRRYIFIVSLSHIWDCGCHALICMVPMFLARLFNNYDCVRILGGRKRYAFSLFILFFSCCHSVCMCFFVFLRSFSLVVHLAVCQCSYAPSRSFISVPALYICRQCDQIPCRLKIIASIVCFW